ncbi:MAG: PASTA domain-containing protein [Pyrinomonadaceae bacterium]|nr:PASTA domain-containing protein [Pyrinomonadaceae bacterium]
MSLVKSSAAALGKLVIVGVLAATFLFGMGGVVYMSLQGEEIKVPDLVGKDLNISEDELASLGLKIKRRAERFSDQKQNTILEQLPKAGETVKTGQMILVVVSKQNPNGVVPDTIKKDDEEDDIEKIEELISDKPKKSTTNDNSNKKKSSKTRDVVANSSTDDSGKDSSDKKAADSGEKTSAGDDKKPATGGDKQTAPKGADKPAENKNDGKKPADKKPNTPPADSGTRPRKTP